MPPNMAFERMRQKQRASQLNIDGLLCVNANVAFGSLAASHQHLLPGDLNRLPERKIRMTGFGQSIDKML